MSIKVRNNDIKVTKGRIPIRSVMLGETCIYGENLVMYKLSYPATPEGVGITFSINNSVVLANPTTSGVLGVAENDLVEVRVYALANYKNPASSLVTVSEEIHGQPYSISLDESVIIERATQYSYIVKSNANLEVEAPELAPKVLILFEKDSGVQNISFSYQKSPYEFAFDTNRTFTPSLIEQNYTNDSIEVYYGSNVIEQNINCVCNEGYKADESSLNYVGVVTNNNQCIVSASTIKGNIVSIFCPSLQSGVKSYIISMVKSSYSRTQASNFIFYNGTSNSAQISQRTYQGNSYYLYEDDVIKISAERKDGYKYPTLGTSGNLQHQSKSIEITLKGNTTLIVDSGEKGKVVSLSNHSLSTGEYVLMDVSSDYTDDSMKQQNPVIYAGDRITIPLDPAYRIGTANNRKPGVGLYGDRNLIRSVTFSSEINYTVSSSISSLIIVLEQGASRGISSSYQPQYVLGMSSKGTKSSKNYGQAGIPSQLCPVSGYGAENFFISAVDIRFYNKRYLGDIIGSKFIKNEHKFINKSFSYSCVDQNGNTHSNVVSGSYNLSNDNSYITVTLSEYNRNWVANTTDSVKFYASQIII